MTDINTLHATVTDLLDRRIEQVIVSYDELTILVAPQHLIEVCQLLRDHPACHFKILIDVCGVDYLHYGLSEWETTTATSSGFERGVDRSRIQAASLNKYRFAAVYHLLSLELNHRLRIRVPLDSDEPTVPSVTGLWPAANWFEREAFDLFGIMFEGHPDLRRILTDYGFVGHPFRKDFPLIGKVEARYDAAKGRVVYDPVSITPRVLEPKVIRDFPKE